MFGDVMVKDGDIFGDGVNVAARLEGLVRGGEICISRGVYDHLHHRGGMTFEDLGEQPVKNIAHPIRAFRLRITGDATEQAALSPADSTELTGQASAPEPNSEPSDGEVALELAFWNSVKDGNPAELAISNAIRTVPSPRWPERGLMQLHCLRLGLPRRPPWSLRTLSISLSGSQSRTASGAKSLRLI
jgi:hypothetical protein